MLVERWQDLTKLCHRANIERLFGYSHQYRYITTYSNHSSIWQVPVRKEGFDEYIFWLGRRQILEIMCSTHLKTSHCCQNWALPIFLVLNAWFFQFCESASAVCVHFLIPVHWCEFEFPKTCRCSPWPPILHPC
jgi:hypothetical protein